MKTTKQDLWDSEYQRKELPSSRFRNETSSHVVEFISFLASKGIVGGNIVDLGCGYGKDARTFAQHGFFVHACDISDIALSVARKEAEKESLADKIEFSLADVSVPWGYSDNFFDAAFDGTTFINLVAEDEINNYFSELQRTLKKQAYGRIVTPVLPDEFYQKLHNEQRSRTVVCPSGITQRTYTQEEIATLLQKHFFIQSVMPIQKRNKMYGKEYTRCLVRITFQNEK